MNVSAILQHVYPGITVGPEGSGDCSVEMVDGVVAIVGWRRAEPCPTMEELALYELPVARASIWERIKVERDRRIQQQGYVAGGKRFHGDTFSRTQQMGLVMLGVSIPPGLQWKTMDGSFVTMTQTLAQQVFAAAAASDIALFAHAEALRAQVFASSDPETVDITAGWPE